MADETQENGQLSAAPESREAQQAAPQETAIPASPDEGRIRTENRENREGLSQGVNDPEAALQQGLAAMNQPEGAKPGKPEEEDLGTNKGAMDKISDGMQKMFALVQKFMKQLQSMGSSTLRGMASTLAMLGFKPAEKWLLDLADSDRSGLTDALKSQAGIALQKIDANDPAAQALVAEADNAEQELAGQYARFGAVGVSRAAFYSQVVAEWVKQNPGKKNKKEGCTAADLREIAAIAQKLTPPAAPQQPQQAQEMFQAIGFDQLPANVSVMNKPFSFPMETGSAVTAQLLQENGRVQVVVNGQKYGIVAGGHALTDLSTDVRKEASGALLFQNRDGSQVRLEKATLQAIVRSIVAGKGANSLDVPGGEVVGVNVGSQILLSPNQKLSALSLVRIS
ncbi:MAG: hypothetical protein Q7S29_00540 [Candidatus Peribacter sp.]|nr:hypothetical protein [Candidatus Peribacter sp.]